MRTVSMALGISAFALGVACGLTAADEDGPERPQRSERIRAAIRADLPSYHPNETAEITVEGASAGSTGGILKLPTVVIRPKGLPEASAYDLMTPGERHSLALRRHPGVKIGNVFHLNEGRADFLLWEEIHAAKVRELHDQVDRVTWDTSADSRETLRLLKAATTRPNGFWAGDHGP